MLGRMSTAQSNPSTFALTHSDSIYTKKNSYLKINSFGNNNSLLEENKISPVKIRVLNSNKIPQEHNELLTNSRFSNMNNKSGNKSPRIFDRNENDEFLRPSLKNTNKNKKKSSRLSLNHLKSDEYQGKTIKFADQVENNGKPFTEIFIVESYREYNQSLLKVE